MITVAIADDEPLVRLGVRGVLETAADITVVAEAADGAEAVDLVREHRPDILLIDVRMPQLDGLSATEILREEHPDTAVVLLTTFAVDEYVYRALRAGAAGFLLKDADPRGLVNAVRAVASGETILSAKVVGTLVKQFGTHQTARAARAEERLTVLTETELQVLPEIARGLSNAEIARTMGMTEGAVKMHTSRMMSKLGCNNRVQLSLIAFEAGMLG